MSKDSPEIRFAVCGRAGRSYVAAANNGMHPTRLSVSLMEEL